jgi:peptidoglycan hydrolase CwlO-like protein
MMSLLEHLWEDLNQRVRSRQPARQTLQELKQALEQEWGRIPQDRIRRLIESMPRRVRAVQVNGGHNR